MNKVEGLEEDISKIKALEKTDDVDFYNIMKNDDAFFDPEEIKNIQKNALKNEDYIIELLIDVGAETARRISEIIGLGKSSRDGKKILNRNYKGLRPMDLGYNQEKDRYYAKFEILKKRHIKEWQYNKIKKRWKKITDVQRKALELKKKPRIYQQWISKRLYDKLQAFIEKNKIREDERIFQLSRSYAQKRFVKCCEDISFIHFKGGVRMQKTKVKGEDGKVVPVLKERKRQPHFHMLRHSWATEALRKMGTNPKSIKIIQGILQHSTMGMTERYVHNLQDEEYNLQKGLWESKDEEEVKEDTAELIHKTEIDKAPETNGLYFLYKELEGEIHLVYIGQSVNLRERLDWHNKDQEVVYHALKNKIYIPYKDYRAKLFDYFLYEEVKEDVDLNEYEREMISEHKPPFNDCQVNWIIWHDDKFKEQLKKAIIDREIIEEMHPNDAKECIK